MKKKPKTKTVQIGTNLYTLEFARDIEKGEPFLYAGNKVLIAENGINVHDNSTHFAIIGLKKVKAKIDFSGMIHPCTCTSYNGGQCYNCLNGAHRYCSGKKKCKKPNSKSLGLRIVVK